MPSMTLADRIKRRIAELDLTQESVANRAGISQGMVYKLVSGKTKATSKLVELASALECELEWLATGKIQTREQVAQYDTSTTLTIEQLKQQLASLPPNVQKTIALDIMESLISGKKV